MSGASEPTAFIASRELFNVAPTAVSSPVLTQTPPVSQPQLDQQMRMPYPADGATAAYRPMGSSPPAYQSIPPGAVVIKHVNLNSGEHKRKRGRPRKYGPDGNMAGAISQQPIGVSMSPQPQNFSPARAPPPLAYVEPQPPVGGSAPHPVKKARGRPPGSSNKKNQRETVGSNGIGFVPHILSVKAGEDVSSKILAFAQNGPRNVCVLTANGVISNVTLRQVATSGGTASYEGRFEILSITGSFMPTEVGGQKSRTGGLSVSLSGPDGRVFGGCVAGFLIAAAPVQVILGSFIVDDQPEPRSANMEQFSGPPRVNLGATAGASSSPSRGTLSESSGGPASPLNLSSGPCNNVAQGMSGIPWK